MKFITSDFLINEINDNLGETMLESKYELVMLIANRAKQIAEEIAQVENHDPENLTIVKPISMSVRELEENELNISRNKI